MDANELMRMAIAKCRDGIEAGQSPFGCAIACDGEVIAVEHNTVLASTDITAHAEVNALRSACRTVGNILLEGAIVATTCEPCPMCTAALHWARVELVYFGATIADAKAAGFNELQVSAGEVLRMGGSRVVLQGETLRDECVDLFRDWQSRPTKRVY